MITPNTALHQNDCTLYHITPKVLHLAPHNTKMIAPCTAQQQKSCTKYHTSPMPGPTKMILSFKIGKSSGSNWDQVGIFHVYKSLPWCTSRVIGLQGKKVEFDNLYEQNESSRSRSRSENQNRSCYRIRSRNRIMSLISFRVMIHTKERPYTTTPLF